MNRLAGSHSPYLLGHAGNPVDWWPWGDDAFAEAARRGVPVFLSIGYATCHWCHVMEHESFEDPATAALLNEAFVCIKVDREERPDVDGIYMAACLAVLGHGGWPLTALLVPDSREPFWIGTYLPRETRGGRMGVQDLAARVGAFWREQPDGVRASAAEIAGAVRDIAAPAPEGDALGPADLDRAAGVLLARADRRDGGWGLAPKFPTPHLVTLALRLAETDADRAADLRAVAAHALRAMAGGGIRDHLGGGFHRYATDRRWQLPHFEKMLYDQAGLALAYAAGARALDAPAFADVARGTLDYVLAHLTHADGTFYCGQDADSLAPDGHMEEGAFYVWTPDELAAALGPDLAPLAAAYWDVRDGGNYLDEATREPTGASVLWHDPADAPARAAAEVAMAAHGETPASLAARLLAVRDRRPPPLTDDKRLTDWNGWMIESLARVGFALGEVRYVAAAARAAARLLDVAAAPDGGLWHRLHAGPAGADAVGVDGMLDDSAFLAGGLLALFDATLDPRWRAHAVRLTDHADARFGRPAGGWFATAAEAPGLLARRVDLDDGAMPAGSSQMVWNHLRLFRLTGQSRHRDAAHAALRVPEVVRAHPAGFAHLLGAVAYAHAPSREIVVAGDPSAPDTGALLAVVRAHAGPDDAVLLADPSDDALRRLAPFTAAMGSADGARAFVCQDHACALPTSDPATLAGQLAA